MITPGFEGHVIVNRDLCCYLASRTDTVVAPSVAKILTNPLRNAPRIAPIFDTGYSQISLTAPGGGANMR